MQLIPKGSADARDKVLDATRQRKEAALLWVLDWYSACLWSPAGAEALEYLRSKGHADHEIIKQRVGWSPSATALNDATKRTLPAIWLGLIQLEALTPFGHQDVLAGCIVMPQTDAQSRPVGLCGVRGWRTAPGATIRISMN